MNSPSPKSTARDKLLASAQVLMLERGYSATTVDEICSLAGVSKGSFYHFFESKEELGLAALDAYYNQGLARLMSGPFTRETDEKLRLFGFLEQTEERAEEFWGHGCLLGTFAVDLAQTHPVIRRRVAEQFERLTAELARLFEGVAAEEGERPTAKELAEGYLAALEGSIVMARAFDEPGRIRAGLESFRRQLSQGMMSGVET